ncbi:MAG: outer membrane beta-barrel protein [Spirochaetes bacterium]|nr:outer membrane beta-barrel protein [Spirochaetota bacterium]
MKKLVMISVLVLLAAGWCRVYAAAMAADAANRPPRGVSSVDAPKADDGKSDSGIKESEGGDWRDPDSEKSKKLDGKTEDDGIEARLKEHPSIRKSKKVLAFNMGFSIGAFGYGILGPRESREDFFKYKYEKGSFTAGFRGGMEALFTIRKRHCISVGLFYEQRIIQVRIINTSLFAIFSGLPLPFLYSLPLNKYVDKSNVDTNYITAPVLYRFYILEEFYMGAGLDVAVLFFAKARYSVFLYGRKTDYTTRLQPIDLGARMVFGFTMNRVFIEFGIGCGVLDYDRIPGERHTLYVTGMIGYRI